MPSLTDRDQTAAGVGWQRGRDSPGGGEDVSADREGLWAAERASGAGRSLATGNRKRVALPPLLPPGGDVEGEAGGGGGAHDVIRIPSAGVGLEGIRRAP